MRTIPSLKAHLHSAQRMFHDLRLPVGELLHEGLRVRIVGHRENLSHLTKVITGEVRSCRELNPLYPWQLSDWLDRTATETDLVYLSLSEALLPARQSRNWLEIPNLVRQVIELPPDERDLLKHLKNPRTCADLNKIELHGLAYEITRQPDRLLDFYHNHYVPYISQRHGSYAYVSDFDQIQREFEQAELLLVLSGGKPIAGCINRMDETGYHLLHLGLRDNDVQLLQQGAISAVYYFSCLEAIRRGRPVLDLGRTIPFLDDGIMFFKRKWNSRILPDSTPDRRLWLNICNARTVTRQALQRLGMIFMQHDQLCGLQWLGPQHVESEKALRARLHRISYAGLARLFLITEPTTPALESWLNKIRPTLDCPVESARLNSYTHEGLNHLVRRLNSLTPDVEMRQSMELVTHPAA